MRADEDTGSAMLYPELFKAFEAVRWNLEDDVPWQAFDGSLLRRNSLADQNMPGIERPPVSLPSSLFDSSRAFSSA